ncbi:MAG TPA: c-type cytochrome [Paracoccaceae bacterium]|nr:c-type cytochrome [Paracoccaceae bacterium]
MSRWLEALAVPAVTALLAGTAMAQTYGLGRPALPEEISAWDVAVLPDGTGLRPGQGSVEEGEEVFGAACAACHGDFAEGIDSWPPLAGGTGSLTDPRPVKTVGSYWPHLSTAWDYIHRSMPFGAAQTLSVDETYAIVAYILYSGGIVEDDFVLSHENFAGVVLPNADGFYVDDRDTAEVPLFSVAHCMADCREPPRVTRRASDLGVTPTDPDGRPAGTLPALVATLVDGADEGKAAEEAVQVAAPAGPDPALVAAGEGEFKKCVACHKVGEGARNGVGPVLNGIVNAAAGQVQGFRYSKPLTDMAASGLIWDEASLDAFLADPKGFMKGTKMAFAGLKDAGARDAVIAYLGTLAP